MIKLSSKNFSFFFYIKLNDDVKTIYCYLIEFNADVNTQKKFYSNSKNYLHRIVINQILIFNVLIFESIQKNMK